LSNWKKWSCQFQVWQGSFPRTPAIPVIGIVTDAPLFGFAHFSTFSPKDKRANLADANGAKAREGYAIG
jgi:hypothetical protein